MNTESHLNFMKLAFEESKKALPFCLPNPPVGCVLVQDGKVVASGYTQAPGHHHAEASAIQSLKGSLSNVTAYVTLEPCSFIGRTPPCANTMIERGIKTVFVAIKDPDPRNNGKGIKMLHDSGINVSTGILEDSVFEFLTPHLNKG